MKNFLFSSFWKISTLAFAVLVIGGISSKTFAYTDAYTDAEYATLNPNTSACTITAADVIHLTTGDLEAGVVALTHDKIYVIPAGTYTVIGDIQMANCSVLVTDADTTGNAILNFQGGKSIISNGEQNFSIRGFDENHKIEILGATSAAGIILQNGSGINISYTTLSGFSLLGGLVFSNIDHSTVSYNTMTYNKDCINFQAGSTNNIINNNTILDNTQHGIILDGSSTNNTISSNTIDNNNGNGIYLDGTNSCTITSNVITNQTNYGIGLMLNNTNNNTVSNNTISHNYIGLYLQNSDGNNFTNNTINNNSYRGLTLQSNSSGNNFNGDTISYTTGTNIEFDNSHYNTFTDITVESALVGIRINGSTYNIFTDVTVANNGSGTKLSTSSYNTFNLTNNTNGIYITNNSNNNSIQNTQILGENNIVLTNGSNNIITGGLFSVPSTPNPSVLITLKNYQTTPIDYDITGTDLSGSYIGSMTGNEKIVTIGFSGANGLKHIIVTYDNNNKQYDSITLGVIVTPPPSGGGGGGGGGGIAICTTTQLVCSGGTRVLAPGQYCQGGNLGLSCTLSGETQPIGNITGSPFSHEFNQAYLRAYDNGITTMNTIQKANMTGYLIRSHMAKMISNFAITLGGLTPNTSAQCTFSDISNQSTEMKFYINLACQLGLMGQNMSKFDPTGIVTRAQFATIMSRLIRGNTHNGGTPYYTNHLNILENAGIITVTTPTMKEVRAYVMIMMKRTYEGEFLNN